MREEFAIIKLPEHVKLPDNDSTSLGLVPLARPIDLLSARRNFELSHFS